MEQVRNLLDPVFPLPLRGGVGAYDLGCFPLGERPAPKNFIDEEAAAVRHVEQEVTS